MKDSFWTQVKSLAQLPGAWKNEADAKYQAYDTKKKLRVVQNRKNPVYGKLKNNPYPSYKKGGKVKKTGLAKVHKGERVLTKHQSKRYEKMRKKVFGL